MRKCTLFEIHRAAGAKFGIYHGWEAPVDYGDADGEFNAACNGSAIFDASIFGTIEVVGKDRLDLLHRLSTNSLAGALEGSVVSTLFLTDKGKLIDRVTILIRKESLLLLTSPDKEGTVARWIDRYTITEDITLKIVTADIVMFYTLGPESAAKVELLFGNIPDSARWLDNADRTSVVFRGPGVTETRDSFVITTSASSAPEIWSRLTRLPGGAHPIGSTAFETYRISRGIPMTGSELTDKFTPYDTGLESDISFTKGCYIGQEIIARLQTYQKIRRGLAGIRTTADIRGAEGGRLFREGKEIGTLTSVAPLRVAGEGLGLCVASLADAMPGTTVTIGEMGPEARVTEISPERGVNQRPGGIR